MPPTNPALATRRANAMFRLSARAAAQPGAIRLELGEPGFPTPDHIVQAALRSIATERQGYGPTNGPEWLRSLVAQRSARVTHHAITPEQVVITAGGTGALLAALIALCAAGDEVLVPDPGWPGYDGILAAAGAVARPYALERANGWQPDVARMAALVSPRARVLLLNSPSNPGGAVFSAATVAALVEFAARHDLWVLSDECYDEIVFDGQHASPAPLDPARVITVGTCSKSYAMTGWRVGWATAPAALAPALAIVAGAAVNNLPLLALRAAEAALSGPQACVAEMRAGYQARRDLALRLLRAAGASPFAPAGAFYLLVDVAALGAWQTGAPFDSLAFAEALLTAHGVAVAPGAAFGATIPDHVRISLASAPDVLEAGLREVISFARAWRG
ncbi:MAG TPA: pyridoxal phosphate-dependent aminotransferase [Ktedonobacterales bacterium]|nr:pyridoxal phosphate-dependent aminotransferase [Ktedonobacterales bacterium]